MFHKTPDSRAPPEACFLSGGHVPLPTHATTRYPPQQRPGETSVNVCESYRFIPGCIPANTDYSGTRKGVLFRAR
jgi:hypothetical protein